MSDNFQLKLFPDKTKPKTSSYKYMEVRKPALISESRDIDSYRKVDIKDIFKKKLLITGITLDHYESKEDGELIPFVLIYAEDETVEKENRYIKIWSASKILVDQFNKFDTLPIRGIFIQNTSYYGRKYYLFVEERNGNTL